jgi:radical SAM protein with 4Fe4S-binding SPASM domain
MIQHFVRAINAFASLSSYLTGTLTHTPVVAGMPPAVSFELTNHCNLRCPECASGSGIMTRERGFMDPALFKRVVSELKPYLYYINLYFQGEPMMHPDFFSFTGPPGPARIVVSTNGHFLTEADAEKLARSGIFKLIVSLDGTDRHTYGLYRKGGDYEKVVQGIRYVSSAIRSTGSHLKLEIQFLVNRHNEYQVQEARLFADEVNAALRLKSMQVISSARADAWMPSDYKYRRYNSDLNGLSVKSTLPDRCLRMYLNPVITWDGMVIPCCFDKNADFIMGDLNRESFRTIWKGEKYRSFKNVVLTGRKSIPMCRNCTSGLKGVIY